MLYTEPRYSSSSAYIQKTSLHKSLALELTVKTSPFVIDRKSYAKAKIGLLVRKIGIPVALLVVLSLVALVGLDDPSLRTFLLCADGFMALLLVCLLEITLTRIFGWKFRHSFGCQRTVELSHSTVRVNAEGLGDSTVSWDLFTGVEKVGNWTFLMQDRNPVVAIPESSFASEDELKAFHQLVNLKRSEFKKKGR